MAMKRQNEFAEGTSEDRARDQLADRIIGLSAAYRTREWQKIPVARVPSHPLKKGLPLMDRHRVERAIRASVGYHGTHDLNVIENPVDPGYVLDDSFGLPFFFPRVRSAVQSDQVRVLHHDKQASA